VPVEKEYYDCSASNSSYAIEKAQHISTLSGEAGLHAKPTATSAGNNGGGEEPLKRFGAERQISKMSPVRELHQRAQFRAGRACINRLDG
jgi:hypothetical protein